MSDYRDTCAGCGTDLYNAKEIGTSSVYDPNGPDFELCMSCYWAQEALCDREGNNQPALLAKYYATFGQKPPASR